MVHSAQSKHKSGVRFFSVYRGYLHPLQTNRLNLVVWKTNLTAKKYPGLDGKHSHLHIRILKPVIKEEVVIYGGLHNYISNYMNTIIKLKVKLVLFLEGRNLKSTLCTARYSSFRSGIINIAQQFRRHPFKAHVITRTRCYHML